MARTTGRPATGTLTLTLEVPSPSASSSASSSTQQSQPPQALVLRLKRPKKKVSWKEGTVDNEFLNRKSSKKCCIFHKQKPFDEDGSDDEDRARQSGDVRDPTPLHGETSGPSYCCAHSDH